MSDKPSGSFTDPCIRNEKHTRKNLTAFLYGLKKFYDKSSERLIIRATVPRIAFQALFMEDINTVLKIKSKQRIRKDGIKLVLGAMQLFPYVGMLHVTAASIPCQNSRPCPTSQRSAGRQSAVDLVGGQQLLIGTNTETINNLELSPNTRSLPTVGSPSQPPLCLLVLPATCSLQS